MTNSAYLTNYIAYLNNASNALTYYFLMIIIPTGILGNLISFYIYTRPSLNRKTNTGFLYAGLCVVNLLSILNYGFITHSNALFNYTVTMPCGLANYLRRTVFNAISWMQVLISFDRLMAVLYPRLKLMKNKVGF